MIDQIISPNRAQTSKRHLIQYFTNKYKNKNIRRFDFVKSVSGYFEI